ncbi:hypothetical protein B0H14DRAFT_3437864 [Mycena olivaceomarginata]|nr:hypothetical protein B0H14DRAFT_3437864 [Mycena olivaceomarginata]
MATVRPWLDTYPNPFSFLALALPTGFPRCHKYHSVVRSLLHPATTLRPPPFARTQVLYLHRIPAPLLAVQPAQTASTQPSSTPPTVLLVPPPPTPTPALPCQCCGTTAAVFFAAVSSAPASSASPTCWGTVYGAISPSLGASWRIRCCTTSHVISVEEQGVQTHPSTLYTTAYETYSKELKNSVPKPKRIPSTQVICQHLIEILADTTP